jgi:DNA polymerase-3 subunit gamma/tau
MAGGWGPQQLATELVDDLRQVFLAALAPELCAASGPSLQRFVTLAEAMSLARVVRSMEILGHAMIDMRDAPDAQVVLEIALVRAVRPDLDSGVEALVERVSALERSLTGAPAFPRPPAPAPAPAAAPEQSAPPPTAEPTAATDRAPADVGRRPSLGAVRRSKQAAGAPAPAAPAAEEAAEPPATISEGARDAGPADEPTDQKAVPAAIVDRDSLTEAWGDGLLKGLPARAKALFSAGRFVSVDERGAHFALPNAAHRDRCLEMIPTVEQRLSAHFGTAVKLVLDVDESGAAPQAPARPPAGPAADASVGEPEIETLDPADYAEVDANAEGDQASEAQARLLEAFPGASEVLG